MSSGAKVTTAIARETTQGVMPTTGWRELPRTSFAVKTSYGKNESSEISSTRMQQATSAGTVDVGGDVGMLFRFGAFDDLLASCFGAEWKDNVLQVGDDNITFSLASTARDIGVHAVYTGQRVGQLAFTIPNDNDITVTATFAGTGADTRSGGDPFFSALDTSATAIPAFDFKNITNLTIDGEALAGVACVDSLNITFNNNIQTQRCLGNGTGFPGNQLASTFAPTGQLTLAWSPRAYAIWAKQKTKQRVTLAFDVANEHGKYTFAFPEVEVSGDWPDGGANDIIKFAMDVSAVRTSPTITRVPNTPADTGKNGG